MSVQDRATKVAAVVESMERDMELLCLTGVEDKLQDGVRPTLELLRNAGIKVCKIFQNARNCIQALIIRPKNTQNFFSMNWEGCWN